MNPARYLWLTSGLLLSLSGSAQAQDAPAEPAPEQPGTADAPASETSAPDDASAAPSTTPAMSELKCPEPTTSGDLRASLESAQARFSALDVDGFRSATNEAEDILPCLSDKFTRSLAAEYHRFRGLRAFVEKDPLHSTLSFAAARSIEPSYQFPESFVPAGNPVLDEYQAIDIEAGEMILVGQPKMGRIEFDGREQLNRANSWPTLVQLFDKDGGVTYTGYLEPGDPMPEYEALPPPKDNKGPNVGLLAGGIGGLVLSGIFYGVGAGARSTYEDTATPASDLDELRGTVNGMQVASITVGIIGVGMAGGSFVLGAR